MIENNFEEKKGFTLIELLVAICILGFAFVGGYILIKGVIDNSTSKMNEMTEKMILSVAEQYAMEFRNTDDWSEEEAGDITSFCISLKSLVNHGYFNNAKQIEKYKDKYLVKGTIKNGVYDYSVIEKELSDNMCKYYEKVTDITNGNGIYNVLENDSSVGEINYNIEKINDVTYQMNMKFSIDFKVEEIIKKIPTYVTLIVDSSGSMAGNKYNNAETAAINFSNEIISNVKESNIALIQYNRIPSLKTDGFINTPLSSKYFNTASGQTNTSGGIDLATSLFYQLQSSIDEKEANFYTVLLYDGLPNYYSYVMDGNDKLTLDVLTDQTKDKYFKNFSTNNMQASCSSCASYVELSSKYLKELNSKLIVIGYEMENVPDYLKKIATKDKELCKDSDYEDYCYYNSETEKVVDLFRNISSTIIEKVNSTNVKKAEIILMPEKLDNGENSFTIRKGNETLEQIVTKIDLSNEEESIKLEIEDIYQLELNENLFLSCTTKECSRDLKLFNIKLVLEYNDGERQSITVDEVPKITVISNKVITLN